ncbi:copper resistance CopC family protein [Sulfitobacter sp. HNIBRBA2951]|jgi:methionine-rich copper-binding protein CopC|uniref:copper resistance CopC family protein n=2 Tax=Sulfitobacter TaxID=60136 RepID=UPI0032DF32C3
MAYEEMKMKNILLAGIISAFATGALAHSAMDETTPAHEAVLTEAPAEVVMNFLHDIRLTRVSMTHADHASVDLDLSAYKGMEIDFTVPMQPMGSGAYVIDWRGLGADGHAMTGSFSFVVE